jgi:hypothetical protein
MMRGALIVMRVTRVMRVMQVGCCGVAARLRRPQTQGALASRPAPEAGSAHFFSPATVRKAFW